MEQLMQDICILCCQTITIYAIGVCDHPVCYKCSARMRALYHQNECAICRKDLQKVVLTQKLQPFSILNQIRYPLDCECEVYFEDDICQKMHNKLFKSICKLCSDKPIFRSHWCLSYHMEEIHKLYLCKLCLKNLRLFNSERKYYTREELDRHNGVGDLDDPSHRGHPICDVCDSRYVDRDELLRHRHHRAKYFCHYCGKVRFYRNIEELLSHCRRMHYLCEDGQCRIEGVVSVFRSEIELKEHREDNHHEKSLTIADDHETCEIDIELRIKEEDKQYEKHHGPINELVRREENWPRSSYINNSNLWDGCLESTSPINIKSMEEFPPLPPSMPPTKSASEETGINSVTKSFATRTIYENNMRKNSDDFPVLTLSGSCNAASSESLCSISSLDSRSQKKISPSGNRGISKTDFENSIPSNEVLTPFFLEEEFTGPSTTIQNKHCPIASKSGNENGHGSNANFNKDCQPFRRNNCESNRTKLNLIEETKSNLEEMICSEPSVTIEETPSLTLEKLANSSFKTKKTETKPHPEFENTTVGNPVIEPSSTFIYTEPPNFKQRNDIFMEKIYSYLHRNYWALREFKSLSDRLLQSSITSKDFCMKCNYILGHTGFLEFIPEILVLLPDINKQQDLLSEVQNYCARETENAGTKPKRHSSERDSFVFEVCATCKQILSKNDFGHHTNKAH